MKTIPFKDELTEAQISNIKEWIAALRSGQYDQGRGQLFSGSNFYCCLGVACEISQIPKSDRGLFAFNLIEYEGAPDRDWFKNRYGFSHDVDVVKTDLAFRDNLMQLNDNDCPFGVIADVIEACFLERREIKIQY